MEIASPPYTFCPDLTGPGNLVQRENITGQDVYHWVEIAYGTEYAPGIPMYYHEYVILAPIDVYRRWSNDQRIAAGRAINEQKQKEFYEKNRDGNSD